ncbi:DUF4440 domain-containing protein [Longispora sp. K20-0274]
MESNVEHQPTIVLTSDPEQHPAAFAAAFNTGSLAAVERVYEECAVFVPSPGQPLTGEHRVGALVGFLGLGLPISVEVRHAYVVDDIALMIVDWVIDGPGPDGEHTRMEGTATDVARRGADGMWRYIIDNPFGTAPPAA